MIDFFIQKQFFNHMSTENWYNLSILILTGKTLTLDRVIMFMIVWYQSVFHKMELQQSSDIWKYILEKSTNVIECLGYIENCCESVNIQFFIIITWDYNNDLPIIWNALNLVVSYINIVPIKLSL